MPESLILLVVIFIVSLALLVFSSDKFVEFSEQIGISLGIPSFVIGVTVVALGTSLPELVSSIVGVLNQESSIVIGNVYGSNITNILLILGVVGIIAGKFVINFNFKKVDLPFFILSQAALVFFTQDGQFTILEAFISLLLLALFIYFTLKSKPESIEISVEEDNKTLNPKHILWLVLAIIGIYLGAKYNIESVIKLGEVLSVPPSIIALTAVALGTSLPELFVSIAALSKNKAEIAVGNVLGSNIFNALLIMGVPRFFGNLEIPEQVINKSMPVLIGATILFVLFIWNRIINWIEGVVLLICYFLFIYISFT